MVELSADFEVLVNSKEVLYIQERIPSSARSFQLAPAQAPKRLLWLITMQKPGWFRSATRYGSPPHVDVATHGHGGARPELLRN